MATFTTTGDNTTITFKYTGLTTVIQNIVGDAAEYLWNHGYGNHGTEESPIVFSSLTNQQKLDLVGEHVKNVIINEANDNKNNKAIELTRVTEEASKYSL